MGTAGDHRLYGVLGYRHAGAGSARPTGGTGFVDALRAWDAGDAVAPHRPATPRARRRALLEALRPTRVVGADGASIAWPTGSRSSRATRWWWPPAVPPVSPGAWCSPRASGLGPGHLGASRGGRHPSLLVGLPTAGPRRRALGGHPVAGHRHAPHRAPRFDAGVIERLGRDGRPPWSRWWPRYSAGPTRGSSPHPAGRGRSPEDWPPTSSPPTA